MKIKLINTTDANGVVWAQKVRTTKLPITLVEVGQADTPRRMVVTENVGKRFKVLDPNFVHERLSPEELRSDSMYAAMTVVAYGAAGFALLAIGALIGVTA